MENSKPSTQNAVETQNASTPRSNKPNVHRCKADVGHAQAWHQPGLYKVRCRNKTRHASGYCYLHRWPNE
jgi:hypothetical protein